MLRMKQLSRGDLRNRAQKREGQQELVGWQEERLAERHRLLEEREYKQYMEDLLLLTNSTKMLLRCLLSSEFGKDPQDIEDYRRGAHQIRATLVEHGYSFSQVLKLVAALLADIGREPREMRHVKLLQELLPESYRFPEQEQDDSDDVFAYVRQRTAVDYLGLIVAVPRQLEFDEDVQDDEWCTERFGDPGAPEQLIWQQRRDEARFAELEEFYQNSSLLAELGVVRDDDVCGCQLGEIGLCINEED